MIQNPATFFLKQNPKKDFTFSSNEDQKSAYFLYLLSFKKLI